MKKWMMLCVATIAISGCVSTQGPSSVSSDSSCSAFGVIRPSRSDTLDTKRQVLVHNRTWRELCEPKK